MPRDKSLCPECGNNHYGKCLLGKKKVYYRCKKPKHQAGEFPDSKGKEPEKRGKTRVFALTQQEAEQEPDMITCILPAFDIPAVILIDFDVTYLFISTSFYAKTGIHVIR